MTHRRTVGHQRATVVGAMAMSQTSSSRMITGLFHDRDSSPFRRAQCRPRFHTASTDCSRSNHCLSVRCRRKQPVARQSTMVDSIWVVRPYRAFGADLSVRASPRKPQSTMPRYLVERTCCSGASARTVAEGHADHCDQVIRANAREGVTWILYFVTADGCRCLGIVD